MGMEGVGGCTGEKQNQGDDGDDTIPPAFKNVFSSFLSDLNRTTKSELAEFKQKEQAWLGEKEALLKTISEKEAGHVRLELENSELKNKERALIREKDDLVDQILQKEEGHRRVESDNLVLKDKEKAWNRKKKKLMSQIRKKEKDLEGSRNEYSVLKRKMTSLDDQLQTEQAKARRLERAGERRLQKAKEKLEESALEYRKAADKLEEQAGYLGKPLLHDEEENGEESSGSDSESEIAGMSLKEERVADCKGPPAPTSNQGPGMNETGNGGDKEFGGGRDNDEVADVLKTSGESVYANPPTPDFLKGLDLLPRVQNQNDSTPTPTPLRRSSRIQIQMVKGKTTTSTFANDHSGEKAPSNPNKKDVRRQVVILEAGVDDFQNAKLAVEGGANSLILCKSLEARGQTPSYDLVANVIRSFPGVKIWILIRPSYTDYCHEYHQWEIKLMIAEMVSFRSLEVEGFAFGVLNSNSEVDEATCRKLIAAARPKKAYFHRAFDSVPHAIPALDTIINLGFDRVMTGGRRETALKGVNCLKEIVQHGANQIEITVCGGLTSKNVLKILKQTGASSVQITDAEQVGPIKAKIRSEYGTGSDDDEDDDD